MKFSNAVLIALAVAIPAASMADTVISKDPDLGDYWYPLGSANYGFTDVYADSFVAPPGNNVATAIGIWLNDRNSGGCPVKFELLATDPNTGGPNGSAILGKTSAQTFATGGNLTLETMNLLSGVSLVAGQTYWVAASCVGLNGSGLYDVGGHTQNSEGIDDNGTFWYSNDSGGLNFDGQNLTPEMAFQIHMSATPEPMSMIALGMGALALIRRKRS